jgi:TonB family protein
MPVNLMKRSFVAPFPLVAVLSLLVAGRLSAQLQQLPGDNAGIAIEQVGVLAYPPGMTYEAIYAGEVRVAISVDEEGRLTDHLVIGYTHEEFAKSAVLALKRWKYQPALVRGQPRASRTEVLFEFRDQGVIVQALPGAMDRRMMTVTFGERYVYAPCRLSELDETPEPVQVVKPAIKSDARTHHVTVEFYIDEGGRVRMPAVDRGSADDYFAAAAVVAVEQWRFKPPLRKGRPVLVRASQEFTFDAARRADEPVGRDR